MWLAAAATVIALVTQDQTPLRASAVRTAPKNAVLWQGDAVEVRGARAGYLQVWDYRRERGGYVLEGQVRPYPLDETKPAALLDVVRLLREMPGMEALGIGHAALYLKIAPAAEIGPEIFDAIGTMAERLGRRASWRSGKPGDDALAAHLDVAQGYGIKFATFDEEGHNRVCYGGEDYERVLQLQTLAAPEAVARAVLGLTRLECQTGTAVARQAFYERAAEMLERVPLDSLSPPTRGRVRLRRIAIWSRLAFTRARGEQDLDAQAAATRAVRELMRTPREELAEGDLDLHAEAGVRAAVTRAAMEVADAPSPRLQLQHATKGIGETCLTLVDAKASPPATLLERCTFGVVWPSTVHVAAGGGVLVVAVQPLEDWRELWVFHRVNGAWTVDVVAPGSEAGVGYVEWAGFSPDGSRLLVAREKRVDTQFVRTFELVRLDTLAVVAKAGRPNDLTAFYRWQAPAWKGQTLALR
jgi:hypothetical protein